MALGIIREYIRQHPKITNAIFINVSLFIFIYSIAPLSVTVESDGLRTATSSIIERAAFLIF